MSDLHSTFKLGPYTLANRFVMAPLTRCRADAQTRVPTPLMTTYYRQRAGAGLILTEATVVTPQGVGYPATPGIYSPEQIAAWRTVTDAVHAAGGRIYLQLWHCGRVSHSLFLGGELPVSSSAVPIVGQHYTPQGMRPFETPRALAIGEIPGIVSLFAQGARHAQQAGFDGVEIHAANGYLIDQFLRDGVNRRDDAYGGTVEKRGRLLREVAEAVIAVWGAQRVGVRLSPSSSFNGMSDSNPLEHYKSFVTMLSELGVSYIHVIEGDESDRRHGGQVIDTAPLRKIFKGAFISCNGFDAETARAWIASGRADLVAFGKLFIANPDLPARLKAGRPLNPWDENTFYTPGEKGYTDYPALARA